MSDILNQLIDKDCLGYINHQDEGLRDIPPFMMSTPIPHLGGASIYHCKLVEFSQKMAKTFDFEENFGFFAPAPPG